MARKSTSINLLNPKTYPWGLYKPVTTADTFEGQTNNLNDEGLYSTIIFGKQGTKERDNTGSYINVKLPIFSPVFFNAMVSLKGIYSEILRGRVYAKWDPIEKDFIKSNVVEGETGYSFFVSHLGELVPKQTDSTRRLKKINFFNKNRDIALTDKVVVTPAGIRDIDFLPNGSVSEQEVNDLYRKLIFRSRSLTTDRIDVNDSLYDNIRWGLQDAFNNIDNYYFNIYKGKSGFHQRKVVRRSIFGATRNVITARRVSIEDCDDDSTIDINSAILGVYQTLLGFAPINVYSLNNGILSRVFTPGIDMAQLVDRKSYENRYVEVDSRIVEKWTSYDGLTKIFAGYSNPAIRNKPIIINNHYLCLTYDDGKQVGLFQGVESLPDGYNKKYLHPTTYTELFYMECSPLIEKKLIQLTRYPIEGLGSIFPAKPIIKPFNSNSGVRYRADGGSLDGTRYRYFPAHTDKPSYFDGMSVHNTKLQLLGADFDGDALSANSLMGEDTIEECYRLFGKREFYINDAGEFLYNPFQEPHEFLLRALTIQ